MFRESIGAGLEGLSRKPLRFLARRASLFMAGFSERGSHTGRSQYGFEPFGTISKFMRLYFFAYWLHIQV